MSPESDAGIHGLPTDTLVTGDALIVALVLGAATLALRLGGAQLKSHIERSRSLESALRWLPVAALAAMVAPAFAPRPGTDFELSLVLAAAATAFVGHWTRNMLFSVAAGLCVYVFMG